MRKSVLNEKQKKFAEFYAESLNAYQSAIKAGYTETYSRVYSAKLLDNVRIKEYISQLTNDEKNTRLASINDINTFWSDLIFDTCADMKDRLKASELRGKVLGVFSENLNITTPQQLKEVHDKLEKALFNE